MSAPTSTGPFRLSLLPLLVPKLCLGTQVSKLCFESWLGRETEFRGRTFPNRVWERELKPINLFVRSAFPFFLVFAIVLGVSAPVRHEYLHAHDRPGGKLILCKADADQVEEI